MCVCENEGGTVASFEYLSLAVNFFTVFYNFTSWIFVWKIDTNKTSLAVIEHLRFERKEILLLLVKDFVYTTIVTVDINVYVCVWGLVEVNLFVRFGLWLFVRSWLLMLICLFAPFFIFPFILVPLLHFFFPLYCHWFFSLSLVYKTKSDLSCRNIISFFIEKRC